MMFGYLQNCVVLPNLKISDGIVIGAGSVVTKDLNIENGIYAGVPAKFIKLRIKNLLK